MTPLSKYIAIMEGAEVVCSEADLVAMIPMNRSSEICSIPNPNRIGVWDEYLAGLRDAPTIKAFRKQHGIEPY